MTLPAFAAERRAAAPLLLGTRRLLHQQLRYHAAVHRHLPEQHAAAAVDTGVVGGVAAWLAEFVNERS